MNNEVDLFVNSFTSLHIVLNCLCSRVVRPADKIFIAQAIRVTPSFIKVTQQVRTMFIDDLFERLGVQWWPILCDCGFESDPLILLDLFSQSIYLLFLSEGSLV